MTLKMKTEMMPHQVASYEKLSRIKKGALYMEMGTGKTRVQLELNKYRLERGKVEQFLWLCPYSVQKTIKKEFETHVEGDALRRRTRVAGIESLSNSTRITADLYSYIKAKKTGIIIDESSLVKNHKAIRTKRITMLAEATEYRNMLNGTPITKSEKDLYSQWYMMDKRILNYETYWSFEQNHIEYDERYPGRIRRVLNVDYLTEKIAPYTYQVKKSECLELPEKNESDWYFSLTGEQYNHYAEIVNEYIDTFKDLEDEKRIYKLFTMSQEMACGQMVLSRPRDRLRLAPFYEDCRDNPRIQALLTIIKRLDDNEKVIIWCRYTYEILDIKRTLIQKYGEGCAVTYYGEQKLKDRDEAEDAFRGSARFLIANKGCAKYGLNLQFCHEMIFYTNDWDWSTKSQAEDRAHRIGQDKNLHIINLIASGTIDERIMECLARKETLSDTFKRHLDELKDDYTLRSWLFGKEDLYDDYFGGGEICYA